MKIKCHLSRAGRRTKAKHALSLMCLSISDLFGQILSCRLDRCHHDLPNLDDSGPCGYKKQEVVVAQFSLHHLVRLEEGEATRQGEQRKNDSGRSTPVPGLPTQTLRAYNSFCPNEEPRLPKMQAPITPTSSSAYFWPRRCSRADRKVQSVPGPASDSRDPPASRTCGRIGVGFCAVDSSLELSAASPSGDSPFASCSRSSRLGLTGPEVPALLVGLLLPASACALPQRKRGHEGGTRQRR